MNATSPLTHTFWHGRMIDAFAVAAAFGLPLLVYLLTMPRTITLEDAGLFQMVCHLGGIGHPPGYPLFTTMCQAFVTLPGVDQGVFALNLLSALLASLACVMLMMVASRLGLPRHAALFSALIYGVSATLWSQAIIVEVYTLAVLLFLCCWWAVLQFIDDQRHRWLYLAAFLFGLALSNHWPLQLLAAPVLAISVLAHPVLLKQLLHQPWRLIIAAICLLAGLSPYLLLFQPGPEIAIYGSIDSGADWLRYIARSAYSDAHQSADSIDRLRYALWLTEDAALQLGIVCLPLIVLGLWQSPKMLPRGAALALVALFISGTFLLNLLINFRFEYFWQAVFRPYPVVSYIALALWCGLGFERVCRLLQARVIRIRWHALIQPCLACALLATATAWNFKDNNRAPMTWLDTFGRTVLEALPQNAVLVTRGDFESGVFGYLHHVAGVRPDIEIRSWDSLVFANRLSSPHAPEKEIARDRDAWLADTRAPVFALSAPLLPRLSLGAFYRYTPQQSDGVARDERLQHLGEYVTDLYGSGAMIDAHEQHVAHFILVDFTRYLLRLDALSTLTAQEAAWLARLQQTFPGILATLETALTRGQAQANLAALLALSERATLLNRQHGTLHSAALFAEYRGRLRLMNDEPDAAQRAFSESLKLWPDSANTSICPLAALLNKHDDRKAFTQLAQTFSTHPCLAPVKQTP